MGREDRGLPQGSAGNGGCSAGLPILSFLLPISAAEVAGFSYPQTRREEGKQ